MTFLDAFEIVAPLDRFDEALLLAHDLFGLPLLTYKRNRPKQKNGYRGTAADICPNMDECRDLVRRLAPRDHQMFERYSKRFEARISRLGPTFVRRVQQLKMAVTDTQTRWQRVPRRQGVCRFQNGEAPRISRALRADNIRCPLGVPDGDSPNGGAVQAASSAASASRMAYVAACASLLAHRNFECPWQYTPNQTLTDDLGCWRPSQVKM